MLTQKISIFIHFLLLCHLGMHSGVHGLNSEGYIKFYGSANHTDLLYKIPTNKTTKCNNFPVENGILNVGSIKTKQCLILHGDPDCESLFSEKVTTAVSWESDHQIGSFQLCSEEIGLGNLHVDLTTFYDDKNSVPEILESYKDVCNCYDIPENIENLDKWSINNNGNDMVAYFEENCGEEKTKSLFIPAGHSTVSREIYKQGETDTDQNVNMIFNVQPIQQVNRIRSFGPDFNSSYFKNNCLKFYALVEKFEIEDKAEFEETDLHVDMFNNVFRNNEHYSMSRTYFVSKVVKETYHVEMDSSLNDMQKILVDDDFEVESNFDQNVFRELAFREVFNKAYLRNKNITLNSYKTFSVKQVMNIAPCTEHKVSAHVSMLRNDGIQFKVLTKISGSIGERKMVAGEVKRFMDMGLEYKGDYDEYTVWAYGNGIVGMTFGTSIVVEGDDIAIPECVAHNQLLTCPACEVCY